MVNAHSHAFQRDLRGAAERPAPEAHAADDFWSWREAMYRLAGEHDPDSMRDGGRARLRRDGGRRLRRGRRVPLRPPPARRHAVRRTRTRWRSRSPRPRVAAGLRDRPPPRRLPPRGLGRRDLPPTPGQRRFCDPDVGDLPRARRRAARVGGRARRASHVGVAAHSVRAVPATLAARRSPPTPTGTASSATCTRTSSRASSRSAAPSTASRPIELLAPHRLPRPAHERRSTASTSTTADVAPARGERHDRRLLPDDRGQPRRRPLPGARLPRRRRADRDRQRLATCASTRSRRRASSRRSRAASAGPATRCWPRYGDLWGELRRERPREPRPATTPARSRSTATIRSCAGVADADLPLAVATCASAAVVATRAAP